MIQIENDASTPSVHKLFSLSIIYGVAFNEMVSLYVDLTSVVKHGLDLGLSNTRLASPAIPQEAQRVRFPVRFDPAFKADDTNRTHVPLPKTGTVTDAEKTAIFARGILNDTGAAYFVKGRSAEYLAQKGAKEKYLGIAREAYHQCATLTYARTFDTQGWFWSTAEACNDRLDAITRQPKGGDTTPAPRPK
jgi:hypothetical protein